MQMRNGLSYENILDVDSKERQVSNPADLIDIRPSSLLLKITRMNSTLVISGRPKN